MWLIWLILKVFLFALLAVVILVAFLIRVIIVDSRKREAAVKQFWESPKGKQLDLRINRWAGQLYGLTVASSKDFHAGEEKARRIGDEIIEVHGDYQESLHCNHRDFMRLVAKRAVEIGRRRENYAVIGYIERWWDGIGGWQA